MTTKATLRPGQNGTKRLIAKYGSRLVCVRYKYDQGAGKRYTTVELIEEVSDWSATLSGEATEPAPPLPRRMAVRVEYREAALREKVKAAGGIWRPRHRLWELTREAVAALGLESRVVADDGARSG